MVRRVLAAMPETSVEGSIGVKRCKDKTYYHEGSKES